MSANQICYLCGEDILNNLSMDHCPPSQFFPSLIRKKHNLSFLLTLPSHKKCNKEYSLDEEYFFASLGPVSEDKYIHGAILGDLKKKYLHPRRQALAYQVMDEFTEKTNEGIYFPNDKIGKKFDVERVENIIWKITRGIYFHEKERILPKNSQFYIRAMDPQQNHPEEVSHLFERVKCKEEKGKYGRIFSYKILESNPPGGYAMVYLFWNHIMFFVGFHGPECTCKNCKSKKVNK